MESGLTVQNAFGSDDVVHILEKF